MSIERSDFDSIDKADLQELIDAQVPESLRIDYKLTNYGRSDSDKRELLKDVSALANAHGGHLILGMEETAGVASRIVGVDVNADAELLRMEQIIRNAIEPPIYGVRMRAVPLPGGKNVFVIRVPRSWNPPHRITAQGVNRFYLRHSAGVHEPSVEELRVLFNQSTTALEKAKEFRNSRVNKVAMGEGYRPLVNNGRLFMHIVPVAAFSGMVNLDVEKIHEHQDLFRPLGASGMSPRFNYHGFVNERGGENNNGYTQIFRNGVLEATKANILNRHKSGLAIPGLGLEENIFNHLHHYINGLQKIGVPPPLVIMFTLEGAEGANYVVKRIRWGDEEVPLPDEVLFLPECLLEDYGPMVQYHRAVRPAFDALWNAAGYSKSQFFNPDGLWVGGG